MYQSFLVLSVLRAGRCRAGVWPTPSPSWTPLAGRVLREVLTGPLSGHQVMLMVDGGVQCSISLDTLLNGLTSPTVLFRTTTHDTDKFSMPLELSQSQSKIHTMIVYYLHFILFFYWSLSAFMAYHPLLLSI